MLRVFALLFTITSFCATQNIIVKGKVTDVNGKPFPTVRIKKGQNSGDSIVFGTNGNGLFSIELPKNEPRNLYIYAGKMFGTIIPLLMDSDDSIWIDIVLDSLVHSNYKFAKPHSRIARFAYLHEYLVKNYEDFISSLKVNQNNGQDTKIFYRAWMDSASKLKQLSMEEKDSVIRGEYLLRYYKLTSIQGLSFDTVFYKKMVLSIPVSSPLWFFNNYEAYDQYIIHPRGASFVDSIKTYYPSRELRAFLYFQSAMEAQYKMDENEVRSNYLILKEDYGDIWYAKIANQFIIPKMNIKRGAQIPDFVFKDISDSTITYSKTSLNGSIYLLDFWATWCLPCVNEIPYLQKVYDKYHSKGFQIISISSDLLKEDVFTFRKQKYAMPWKHVWISESELKSVQDKFEVSGIPKPILVNGDGKIVGIKAELRNDELEKMLNTIFKQ